MRVTFVIMIILVQISLYKAHAADVISCPFCHEEHEYANPNSDANNVNAEELDIPIDSLPSHYAAFFPCCAQEIKAVLECNYMPGSINQARSIAAGRENDIVLSKEQLLQILFISSIAPINNKMPITVADYQFFATSIKNKANKKNIAWLTSFLFLLFSGGGALSNVFDFITLYGTELLSNNSTNILRVPDETGSLWLQNTLTSTVTFVCGFLSSMTNFSWANFGVTMSEDKIKNYHNKQLELDNRFTALSYALLALNSLHPLAAKMIADNIDENVISYRAQTYDPKRNLFNSTLMQDFLSVVDYIKSKGKLRPTSLPLQLFIANLQLRSEH